MFSARRQGGEKWRGGLREPHGPPFVCLGTLKGLKRKCNVFWPLKCNNIVYAVVEFRLLTVPQRRVTSLEINSLNARGICNNEVHF